MEGGRPRGVWGPSRQLRACPPIPAADRSPAREHPGRLAWGHCAVSVGQRAEWALPARSCCLLGAGAAVPTRPVSPLLPSDPGLLQALSLKQGRLLSQPAERRACLLGTGCDGPPQALWAVSPRAVLERGPSASSPLPSPLQPWCLVPPKRGPPGDRILTAPPLLHVPPETAWPLLLKVFLHPFHLWVCLPAEPSSRWASPGQMGVPPCCSGRPREHSAACVLTASGVSGGSTPLGGGLPPPASAGSWPVTDGSSLGRHTACGRGE